MDYKREIVKLLEKIDNVDILRLLYGFVKSGYKEENAGKPKPPTNP